MQLKHPVLSKSQRSNMVVLNYGRGLQETCYLRQKPDFKNSVVFIDNKCDGNCYRCFFSSQNSTECEVRMYLEKRYKEQY